MRWMLLSFAVRAACAIAALAGDGTTTAARAAAQTTPGVGKGKPAPGAGGTGGTAEGGAKDAPRSPAGYPAAEDLRNWRPDPAHRHRFADVALARLVEDWQQEVEQ